MQPAVYLEMSNDKKYTDLTVCVRIQITAFPVLGAVVPFVITGGVGSNGSWSSRWNIGIYQPLSGFTQMGKQVSLMVRKLQYF